MQIHKTIIFKYIFTYKKKHQRGKSNFAILPSFWLIFSKSSLKISVSKNVTLNIVIWNYGIPWFHLIHAHQINMPPIFGTMHRKQIWRQNKLFCYKEMYTSHLYCQNPFKLRLQDIFSCFNYQPLLTNYTENPVVFKKVLALLVSLILAVNKK